MQFIYVILAIAAASVGVAGIQFFKGHNFMPFGFLPRGDYGARASGFFGCPNHLAGFLEVAMLFALSIACWGRSSLLIRIVMGYASAMCAAGILLTGSRGGYASTITGLAAFGFISLLVAGKWLRREFWYATAISAVLGATAVGYVIQSAVRKSEFLQYRVESANLDIGVRADLARAAFKQFQINPWFGTGSRTYLYHGREFRTQLILADPIFAHNDYAQLLGEYGLIGFGTMALFVVLHLRSGWKTLASAAVSNAPKIRDPQSKRRSEKGSRSRSAWRAVEDVEAKRLEQVQVSFKGSNSIALTAAALASVAAYAVHSLVDFNLHIPANACMMAFVFAVLVNPGGTSTPGSAVDNGSLKANPLLQRVPAAFGLPLLTLAILHWPGEYYGEKARRLLSDWRLLESPDLAVRAEVLSKNGLKYDSKNPELLYYLGESQSTQAMLTEEPQEKSRLCEQAIISFQRAVELAPRDVRYVLCLAWSFDAAKRFDEAELVHLRALQLDPNSNKVHASYAAHFQQQGKLEQAEAEYATALKKGNTPHDVWNLQNIQKEIQEKKSRANPAVTPAN